MNEEKTEFLVIGTRQQLDKVSLDEMAIGHTKVKTTTTARSLGVWFDRNMKFDTNILSARTLTQATIIARLDYCNSLLYGCSDGKIKMLQRLQTMAARLICNSTRFCRITPLMFKLHWLPVKLIIKYKILLMTYKAIHGLSPDRIQSLVQVKKKSLYNLRSNYELLLGPPTFKSNKTAGNRAFQVAVPSEWSKLPKSLRLENDLKSFK